MSKQTNLSPAEIAAQDALDCIYTCIREKTSFILEAGAGAGKTHSLVQALRHIIKIYGRELIRNNQRVACITYTNVAKNEIRTRTDGHPAVLSETIHAFCWSVIKDFQPKLRAEVPSLGGRWADRIAEHGEIGNKTVKYDLGYPKIDNETVWLGHNDIIALAVKLLEEPKFRTIFKKRYPILFIDEYQDTDKDFASALKQHFLGTTAGPQIGFFGDHWQKIYGSSACGKIEHTSLVVIEKKANFRSDKAIVDCLNRFRSDLPQNIKDPTSTGSIVVFHTNNWQGTRLTGGHWDGDLPHEVAHGYLVNVRAYLTANEWDLSPEKTKVLMLTHNVLADEQGYRNLANVFSRTESFIKKEDDYIAFFEEVLEPACLAYEQRKYGEMIELLSSRQLTIKRHSDKVKWTTAMDKLFLLRQNGTIGEMIDQLKATKLPRLPDNLDRKESRYSLILGKNEEDRDDDENEFVEQLKKLKAVPYKEVTALVQFIQEKTPFATKHGVKGSEFENVLVVFGRGWNQYNFGQMLEWAGTKIPNGKHDSFERNRNLFYVACSRPKKRLALLFTQSLSNQAMATISNWFGAANIRALGRAP